MSLEKWTSNLRTYTTKALLLGHVREARQVQLVRDGNGLGRTVAVLGQNQVCLSGSGAVAVVTIGAVDEDHQIRILLQLTGFAQVRELRELVGALFGASVELADGDHRHVEFLGQQLHQSRR